MNYHRVYRPAGGLDQTLAGHRQKNAYAGPADDGEIGGAVVHNAGNVGLDGVEQPGTGQAQNGKYQAAHKLQHHAVHGGAVGPFLILLAQAAGEQGVDAHAGAHRHGDHQVLHRKGQRHRVQRVLAQLGHEIAVHNVVAGLDQHRHNHGQRHVQQQLVLGHNAHFVFARGL